MDTFTQRMLRRAASLREKQKTPEYRAALLKTRSLILKAVNIDYEDVSCEAQSSEVTGQTGAVLVHTSLSSNSLDPGEKLDVTSNADMCTTGTASEDYCENDVAVCSLLSEEHDNCLGQSCMFHFVSVHSTSPSKSLDLVCKEETCGIVQTYESQDGSENEATVPPFTKLNEQFSLDIVTVAARVNQELQADVGMHGSVPEGNDDSDSTAFFSPCTLLTSPVPTEHQEPNSTRISSDADKKVILKVANQLSLAHEVCEVEGDAEHCTELSGNSYDIESFLIEALGDEQLASTQSEPKLCHRSSLLPSEEGEGDGLESPFLSVRKYRTLAQLARQKLKTPLPTIPILKPADTAAAATSLEDEQQKYKESLRRELYTQKVLMLQCSKALSICKTTREFHASVEHVEAERGLLLSSCRCQAALKEIEHVQDKRTECEVSERGTVTISSISLSLKEESLHIINSEDSVFWFVCTALHGQHVFATRATQIQKDNRLNFMESFRFVGLPKDFVITLEVYSLRLRKVTLPYEERYHIGRQRHHMCPVPFKLHHRDIELDFSPYMKTVKTQSIRTTSFSLIGSLDLKLPDLHQQPAWVLNKVPLSSPLTGDVTMVLHSSLELWVEYSGFLSMMETLEFWQRRWFCLRGHMVSYWDYPHDQIDKPPVGEVDLRLSVSQHVSPVDRAVCPRPRTLLLEMGRQSNAEDCNTQDTITRYLWQADSTEELSEWCAKLTGVLCALKQWNISTKCV
ncbi:anillin isoform X2 [Cryptotermes secundus]|uniref:anillin isoform X2 n=1 Tax=Cryptotermes secundus TaxID=105785 RepID=UPI000CD7C3A8|nr:anillin isoform X2 [Cryptotermes secundus]